MYHNLQIIDILISNKNKNKQDDSYKQIQLPIPEPPLEWIIEQEEKRRIESESTSEGGVVILDIFGDDVEDSI